jgi:hypothetical protein
MNHDHAEMKLITPPQIEKQISSALNEEVSPSMLFDTAANDPFNRLLFLLLCP